MNLSHVARSWQAGGVSVIPILANQTKRPAIKWAEYQVRVPTLGQVEQWWGNGRQYGIAVICGQVSGNLEMTEIEGRACGGEPMTRIMEQIDALGIRDLWNLLTGPSGYSEMSPSGGIHLLYRVGDRDVPGNTKIAQAADNLVLAETRGEGGYVIVAPTPGICHPSGEAWVLLQGEAGRLPVISWEQRSALHRALAMALDESDDPAQSHPDFPVPPGPNQLDFARHPRSPRSYDPPLPPLTGQYDYPDLAPSELTSQPPAAFPTSTTSGSNAAGLSPGDQFELDTDWSEILVPHGWRELNRSGQERFWVRPGKDGRNGHSATTSFAQDRDRFFCFSTSTEFDAEVPYTKFAVYAILNCGGNFQVAAQQLARQQQSQVAVLDTLPRPEVRDHLMYTRSDDGNARYLYDRVKGRFLWFKEEKTFLAWDGKKWCTDGDSALAYAFQEMCREMLGQAEQRGDDISAKWWLKCLNKPRIDGVLNVIKNIPGFTVRRKDLDRDKHLVNLDNGIYDLDRHELRPHDPDLLMTQIMAASYRPTAPSTQFDGFMERVLPDPSMRSYVQRALGYSILGDADRRSLFLVCGPSGTGKSTLMNAMELLFGDYGATAPSGTLRSLGRESSGPSNDLHTLMGKRFVSTSETNEHTAYNEDLIKRLTGRDTIKSRKLYQEFQEWSPRCAIWLATNHAPRFNSDDDAIWRRAKIVPFNTVLLDEGEIPDFAHNVLAHELDGILNWVLAGLKAYQEHGLDEPELVQQAISDVRIQSDPVSRFVEDRLSDGYLVRGDDVRVRCTELYTMYVDWTKLVGERALGSRRFQNRLLSAFPTLDHAKINGNYFWRGIGRSTLYVANWAIQGYSP